METYRFVHRCGGWWLMIRSVREYLAYADKTRTRDPIVRGFTAALHDREAIESPDINGNAYLIGLRAGNEETSIAEAAASLIRQADRAKLDALNKGYHLYFNRAGGWNYGGRDYSQWVDRHELVFPDFTKDQICVEQFPGGTHFYAYIDTMQVRDGDTLKWDTYEEAYAAALCYVEDDR